MGDDRPTGERHIPVLRDRCVSLIAPAVTSAEAVGRRAVVVDATLGMGGHSESMLERFPQAHLVGIDRDTEALGLAGERLAPFSDRTDLVHAVYDELPDVLADLGIDGVDGVLFH